MSYGKPVKTKELEGILVKSKLKFKLVAEDWFAEVEDLRKDGWHDKKEK